mmetsp:Transcript_1682/g.3052  ORF Transcript_1682/g.3052 Transcript_1682/m.3052 type:complete len:235 (-) Transcript_1682:173-877(-)
MNANPPLAFRRSVQQRSLNGRLLRCDFRLMAKHDSERRITVNHRNLHLLCLPGEKVPISLRDSQPLAGSNHHQPLKRCISGDVPIHIPMEGFPVLMCMKPVVVVNLTPSRSTEGSDCRQIEVRTRTREEVDGHSGLGAECGQFFIKRTIGHQESSLLVSVVELDIVSVLECSGAYIRELAENSNQFPPELLQQQRPRLHRRAKGTVVRREVGPRRLDRVAVGAHLLLLLLLLLS